MGNEALPLFDDDAVAGVQVRVTGTIDTPAGKVRHLGYEVIMLTIGSVVRVVHLNVDDRLVRAHVFKVSEVLDLEEGEAAVLVAEARERSAEALDQLLGRSPLPFDDDDDGEAES